MNSNNRCRRRLYKGVVICAAAVVTLGLFVANKPAYAQSSAVEMLEEARARARDMEELKAVLNGPDQNMRLASFDIMVNSGDEAMRQIAIDAGLASADSLMQAMAFKEAILSLDRIVLSLEIDTSQSADVQTQAQKILDTKGSIYEIAIIGVDRKTGVFKINNTYTGQVSGLNVSFKYSYDTGTFSLLDETTIQGPVTLYQGGYGGFIATAKIR
jgi:hypothetical protein